MSKYPVPGFPFFLVSACLAPYILSAQPIPLPYRPISVDYSRSLDRLITISANPNKVHVVNLINGSETTVNLSLAPLSLSVSPDGTHAAVGHDGWISYVNLSSGYVEKNLAVSLTANMVLLAGNGSIWVPPTATINIATGVQTTSGYSPWSVNKPALHPNGNWIYYTRGGSPDDVIKGDISSGTFQYLYDSRYHGDFPVCAGIFYSADGNRLVTGCGTLFRTTASASDDIVYNGALSAAQFVNAAADSAVTHQFAVIPGAGYSYNTTTADTELQFYDDNYLTLLGRVSLPTYTSGSVSAPWRGRYLFYSPDSSKLYLVLQADAKANLTNDYAIYTLTLSTGSGCGPSLGTNSTNVAAGGGALNVTVTATSGCLWQASSNATWLYIGAGGVSSGNGTVTIQAAPNLQTVARTATVTIAGLTYTVIQDAAPAAGSNPVSSSPVRPVAADYSAALDRMILVSTNPDLLTILDPVTGASKAIALVMPPTALSISPDGLHAAVGHDGRISYVNLSNASVEKTFPVTTNVYSLALGATDIYAFPLHDQWQAVRVVNIASGVETLWNTIYAGSTAGKITPNGKYLYINAVKRYDISAGPPPSAFDSLFNSPLQWFSQDSQRLFSGSGSVYRLSSIASQDLQYNGTIGGVQAVADSTAQQVTAVVASASNADKAIGFVGQQFLAPLGSVSIPKITSGANSYDAHGRYLFWNSAGSKLFAIVQADAASGLLNDYAIYTVSWAGGCNTAFDNSTASVTADGGAFTATVTATTGCAWRAVSNTAWLNITANAFSAGGATISYVVDPNPTLSARTATITVDGKTLTVTQAAGTQVKPAAVVSLPFRAADAEYSVALDRIVAVSSGPNRLNIYDPATLTNTPVALPLPGNAVSVSPNGLRAAVGHDGAITIVNLQTATIEKTVNVSITCYDVALADNGYVYASMSGGWGTSVSVNIASGVETRQDLLYDGLNFRVNPTGDAVYTAGTQTSSDAVSRFTIASGPMKLDYQSQVYGQHPMGNFLWFTNDGRFVTDSGTVYRTGSTLATDFIYTGTLSSLVSRIGSITHSVSRGLFASVASNGYGTSPTADGDLYLHGDKYLALGSKMALPKITVSGVSAASHGRFTFWDSTASKLYVIMQADPSAGFLNDYALYTFSPAFSAGCAVTLGISSGTAIAFPNVGNVAVSAPSDCIWEVKSNASWINIDTGTLGVGTGNVGFSVLANNNASPRTGTITVGGQTFTLTQSAGAAGAVTKVGVFRGGTAYLLDSNGSRGYDPGIDRYIVTFNQSLPDGGALAGDVGVSGDWTGDQIFKIGVYRPSSGKWFLDSNNDGIWDAGDANFPNGYNFGGLAGDMPVVGDWTGSNKSCIGIYRSNGSVWLLDLNCNGTFDNTPTDAFFPFGGLPGDVPVVGKWTGGTTKVGVVRKYAPGGVPQGPPFFWVLDAGSANAGNAPANHPAAAGSFPYGGLACTSLSNGCTSIDINKTGDLFVVGDWLGTGTEQAGVYRQGSWILDLTGAHTYDTFFQFGGLATDIPVTGKW